MNILFLDQFSEPGGAQLCLRDLMPEVHRRGWQSYLLTPGNGLPLRRCANGKKTALDFIRYSIDLGRMARMIGRIVREKEIDLVYVNGPRVLPAVAGLRCPILFHAHSRMDKPYARKLIGESLRRTKAAVIAVSRFVARDYPEATVIYNGVADFFDPRSRAEGPARIGMLGRIAPEKGHLDFVRAAKQITGVEFFIYGEALFADAGYHRAVRATAECAGVRFLGWTDDPGHALKALDVLVAPSGANEAASRVVAEAFSAGTPVVAYPSGGVPELIDHGRTGILTDAPNPDSITRAVRNLIGNPALRNRLSAEARIEWQRRFTIERFQKAVCDRMASHATTDKRRAQSARAPGDGAATETPEPPHPE